MYCFQSTAGSASVMFLRSRYVPSLLRASLIPSRSNDHEKFSCVTVVSFGFGLRILNSRQARPAFDLATASREMSSSRESALRSFSTGLPLSPTSTRLPMRTSIEWRTFITARIFDWRIACSFVKRRSEEHTSELQSPDHLV